MLTYDVAHPVSPADVGASCVVFTSGEPGAQNCRQNYQFSPDASVRAALRLRRNVLWGAVS